MLQSDPGYTAAPPSWITQAIEVVHKADNAKRGVSPLSYRRVNVLLSSLEREELPLPAVAKFCVGGLSLTWERDDRCLEICFDANLPISSVRTVDGRRLWPEPTPAQGALADWFRNEIAWVLREDFN